MAEATLELLVQEHGPLLHLRRRPHRAEGVVLVRDRYAEDPDDSVADELLDRPAVPLDGPPHLVEVAEHQGANRFGVEALAHRGRASNVAEEHRRGLPPLPNGRDDEPRPAGHAEAGPLRVLLAALRAKRHV